MQFWYWILLFTAPVVMFSVKPSARRWHRIGRIALAIALTYLLMNIALLVENKSGWQRFDHCQSQFADGATQQHVECTPLITDNGATNAFFLAFGWIPAVIYVGFWELLWRMYYRASMVNLRKGLGDDRWSNALVSIIYYFALLIGCILLVLAVDRVYPLR